MPPERIASFLRADHTFRPWPFVTNKRQHHHIYVDDSIWYIHVYLCIYTCAYVTNQALSPCSPGPTKARTIKGLIV